MHKSITKAIVKTVLVKSLFAPYSSKSFWPNFYIPICKSFIAGPGNLKLYSASTPCSFPLTLINSLNQIDVLNCSAKLAQIVY
jgi:hypothetical protein